MAIRQVPIRTDSAARRDLNKNYVSSQGEGGTGALDTWGLTEGLFGLGGKNKDLKEILDNPNTQYTPGEGYKLNWWQRNVSKITDQDVYNARRTAEVRDLRNTYGDEAEKFGIDIDGTTSAPSLNNQLDEAKEVKRITGELRNTDGGNERINKLKGLGPLTSQSLQTELTDLKDKNEKSDPLYKQNLEAGKQSIAASKASIANTEAAQTFRETQATSDNLFRKNQLKWQQQQSAKNDQNRWEDKREQRQQQALTREMNAENNMMQMQLEYSRLDRQDKRDAKDSKDKAIMLLVQGLGNLATSFTV